MTPKPKHKVHYKAHYDFGGWSFCGVGSGDLTEREELVTCKRCLDRLGRQAIA